LGAALSLVLVIAGSSNVARADETDDEQFREDVIQCEEAIARLEDCCPDFDSSKVLCDYYYDYDGGCGSSREERIEPALSKSESQCIRRTSCGDLVAQGVCKRAQAARIYHYVKSSSDGGPSTIKDQKHPPVCR
jgi:hypothetical protein